MNAGISFFTPEEFFINPQFHVATATASAAAVLSALFSKSCTSEQAAAPVHPSAADVCETSVPLVESKELAATSSVPRGFAIAQQEMVVLVGSPASGKTTVYTRYFEPDRYAHVSRDILGTTAKCVQQCRAALKAGLSVVIDNTNPSVDTRKTYLEIAKEFGVSARCFYVSDLTWCV